MSLFDIHIKPSGGIIAANEERVNLQNAQKLKRYGYPQGQSSKFYEKRKNCSVYDLKVNTGGYRNDPVCYDAPTRAELSNYITENENALDVDYDTDVNKQAEIVIKLLKEKRKRGHEN